MSGELTPDQARLAGRIEAALTKKDASGEYVYTQDEVRDFIAAVVFELDLPTTGLEGAMTKFLAQFDVDDDASDDDLVALIKGYFAKNPLNPELMAELEAVGRSELLGDRDDYDEAALKAKLAEARTTTGNESKLNAPRMEQPKAAAPKPKRGLS